LTKYEILDKPPYRYHHAFVDIAEVNGDRRLYYGQWVWVDFSSIGGDVQRVYAAVFDDGTVVVETGEGELEQAGIRLRRVPAEKPEPRWPPWAITFNSLFEILRASSHTEVEADIYVFQFSF